MELNDLKAAWQNSEPEKDNFLNSKSKNTEMLIKQKSQSIAHQIRNRFYLEIIIGLICFLIVAFAPFVKTEIKIAYLCCALVIIIIFTPTLIRFHNLIQSMEVYNGSLKEAIFSNVNSFEHFLKYYIKINTILTVFALILSLVVLRYFQFQGKIVVHFPKSLPQFIIFTTITCIAVIPITKWYINFLYGNYAKRLRTLLEEIESE